MYQRCEGVLASDLENYWELNLPGRGRVQPLPRLSYQEALAEVKQPPTEVVPSDVLLNTTTAVEDDAYWSQYHTLTVFEDIEKGHSRFG